MNGDGLFDVVTANTGNDTITVLRGKGDGTFKPAMTYAVGVDPVSIAKADFNADGKTDLAVANKGSGTVTLLFGGAAGVFTAGGTVTVGASPSAVVAADFNNDTKPDLATVSGGFGHLDVNLNLGTGTFAAKVNYDTGFVAESLAVGDFNGDTRPDLAVGCTFPSNDGVSILLGNIDGTFQAIQTYDVGGQTPAAITAADLDGDGILDLATANGHFANNSVSVLKGTGTGSFGGCTSIPRDRARLAWRRRTSTPTVASTWLRPTTMATSVHSVCCTATAIAHLSLPPTLSSPGPDRRRLPISMATPSRTWWSSLRSLAIAEWPSWRGRESARSAHRCSARQSTHPNQSHCGTSTTTSNAISSSLHRMASRFFWVSATALRHALRHCRGTNPQWVVVDDFNGDTKPDLAVANDDGVSILLGNGDGTFAAATTIAAGGAATYLESGDFNRDGRADLAVVHTPVGNASISILLGHGDATFTAPKSYSMRDGPGPVGVGDFNRDGKTDLAIPTFFGFDGHSAVAILRNKTAGTFVAGGQLATDSRPIGITVRDLTGDGKLDLAVVNNFGDTLTLFAGRGDGTFNSPKRYVVGDRPTWVTGADFNGDGQTDLAVVNSNAGTVTLLQTPAPATHFHLDIVPDTTAAGTVFKVAVSALDAAGRLATNFTGKVHFSSTDAKALLPVAYTFTAANFGVKRFNVTLKTAGIQTITATSGGVTGTDSVDVIAAAANHYVLATVTTATAGAAFDVSVTAVDPFNNVATGYRGTIHFSSTDLSAALPLDYGFQAGDGGTKTFSATLQKLGLQTITVKDTVKTTLKKEREPDDYVMRGDGSRAYMPLTAGCRRTRRATPGHPPGVVGRQERRGAGDVLGLADPPQRASAAISCRSSSFVFPLFSLFMSVRVEPGREHVDADPLRPEFGRQHAGHHVDRPLGRGVHHRARGTPCG